MSQETGKPKYIIVLGTTCSGSGAVYDYLAGRGDLYDPLRGSEYLLPHAPHGLMALEAAAGPAFSPAVADHAVVRFLDLARKLERHPTPWSYGGGYSKDLASFYSHAERFIEEVSAAKMPMRLHWRVSERNSFEILLAKVLSLMGRKEEAKKTALLVDRERLVEKSRLMHDRVFLQSENSRPVLLNQAGSGWNPVESTKYFGDRRVVLVTRDPRDQFAELKMHKKACNVDEFIKWFRQLEYRINALDNSIVMRIGFENFVREHDSWVAAICGYLGVAPDVASSYQLRDSAKNVGKYTLFLSKEEIFKIERCFPYCQGL